MAFKTIEKMHSGGAPATGVAIGRAQRGRGLITKIRFGPDILEAMNWAPGCRVTLAHGDGPHAGKLRIGADELNGFKILEGRSTDKSKFMFCSKIGDGKKHKREAVSHKITDGYLYIDLPDWAKPAA